MINTITVREAAGYLHVRPRTVCDWIKRGKLRARRIGKSYLISESDLRAALVGGVDEFTPPAAMSKEEKLRRIRRMRGALLGRGLTMESFFAEKRAECV